MILAEIAWPVARLGEAIEATARRAGLRPRSVERAPAPRDTTPLAIERWAEDAGAWLGVDVEPIETSHADLLTTIRRCPPALLRVVRGGVSTYLAVIAADRRGLTLVGPNEQIVRASIEDVAVAVAARNEDDVRPLVDALLDRARVPASRREAARRALLAARLRQAHIDGSFMIGPEARTGLLHHARLGGLGGRLVQYLAAYAVSYALFVLSWTLAGRGALSGRIDRGWIIAWALLLLTQLPLRVLATWSGGRLAIEAGVLLKKRLLAGALALDVDHVRGAGVGQIFGSVVEVEAFEALALGGGMTGLLAVLELGFAASVLALGAAPAAHLAALAGWLLGAALLAAFAYRARERWTRARLDLTHDLVERMVGHRTRLAQQPPDRWHDGEDQSIAGYLAASARMDRLLVLLSSLLPRGFLALAVALLVPSFAAGAAAGSLAVSVGGIVLARGALARFAGSLSDLAAAAIAWKTAAPLLSAAADTPPAPHPDAVAPLRDDAVIDAQEITFHRPGRAAPILAGVNLKVRRGDRLLLQGPSGSGKSTLGAILAGLLDARTGLLLVGGLDRHTLGARAFRRRVVAAPQFHDNHVFSATFAFNVLMGRAWPPRPMDLDLAEEICRELDLGPLLDRMPAGMHQMVGETGWQLSHGERSRLYIARALLVDADLIVLDESFGALDPETLESAMKCVLRRANALLVIAHP